MPGGTLLVVHHTNKGQHDDFQDAVSGTQGIAGAADFTMHLARKRKSPQGFLSITGGDVTENEYAVTFQEDGRWTLDGGHVGSVCRGGRGRQGRGQTKQSTQDAAGNPEHSGEGWGGRPNGHRVCRQGEDFAGQRPEAP